MDILRTIKYLGFNAIRLPFSNELVERNPVVHLHIAANPEFRGKHALQILDAIINGARQVGLMIILDNHLPAASGPGPGVVQESALWYLPPHYTQQRWLADWLMLARRYRDNPAVVGVDLHNEPHSDGPGLEILGLGYLRQGATWGPFEGRDNPATDWRLAAEQAGNAILHVNPHLLIIVEGVEIYPYRNPLRGPFCPDHIPATGLYCADLYWWGGNLAGAKDYPVVLDEPHHLVYSAHEYGPQMHGQRWFTPHMSQAAWQQQMYKHWGYLLDVRGPNAAPVFVGEFGTSANDHAMRSMSGTLQGRWFWALIDYLHHHRNVGWAYWALNGTRSEQPDGVRSRLDKGLLATDWARVASPTLLEALHTIQQ
jgi:endoglucanase